MKREIIKGSMKSKTILFNVAIGLVGGVEAYSGQLSGLFGNQAYFGLFMVAISGVGVWLRTVTTKPLVEK